MKIPACAMFVLQLLVSIFSAHAEIGSAESADVTVDTLDASIDFGAVTIGKVSSKTFTLTNPGLTPIVLTGNPLVEIRGGNAGDFKVSVPPGAEIPVGGSVHFEVRFAPTNLGKRRAQVNGDSYDAYDQSPINNFHPSYNDGVTPYTAPVGSFAVNGYGLCDMAGNVWEWCWDWYGSSYYTTSNGTTDPWGPEFGILRVLRGGSWDDRAFNARCASRAPRHARPHALQQRFPSCPQFSPLNSQPRSDGNGVGDRAERGKRRRDGSGAVNESRMTNERNSIEDPGCRGATPARAIFYPPPCLPARAI